MFFKKKEDDLLAGKKRTPDNKKEIEKRDVVKEKNEEEKKPVKKDVGVGHSLNKPIKENFVNYTDVPENSEVVSENKEGDFLVEEHLRENIIILKSKYSPLGMGDKIDCLIVIATQTVLRSNMDMKDLRMKAREKNLHFVICLKKDAKKFIDALRPRLNSKSEDNLKIKSDSQQIVVRLFREAVANGVSDLHLEVSGPDTFIRTRQNGDISYFNSEVLEGYKHPAAIGYTIARTIYNSMATVSGLSFNERDTQDALVEIKDEGINLRVRVATAPTEPAGFDMVMRLLVIQDSTKPLTLSKLGYQKKQSDDIEEAVAQGVGVTIIAGTTGSGKSTTLQNVLMTEINNRNGNLKVITVEDPPEYFIPGASQIPVIRDKDGSAVQAFKKAIKASMRMDPDVIMIGEVRDTDSAKLLIEAVQTGHKVLSTIHASSALSIISRLENLGIERDVLGDTEFISGLIYQKLFPVLCKKCCIPLFNGEKTSIPSKKPLERVLIENNFSTEDSIRKAKEHNPNLNLVRALQDANILNAIQAEKALDLYAKENNEEENEKFLKRITSIAGDIKQHNISFRGNGCPHCKKGIVGRTVVSEVIRPDMNLRELIAGGQYTEIYKYWRKNLGGKTAKEDAYDKMLNGTISPVDIEETFGFINPSNI